MTLREALLEAANSIARRDAETLVQHLLTRDRAWLLAHLDDPIDDATHAQLRELTTRRAAHEPLQHLTGTQEFFGLPLRVTPDVLIPRPETELLVEAVLDWATSRPTALHILDVGTGSGAIAIALAHRLPHAVLTAVDLSQPALSIARENAATHGLNDRIGFVHSDLLDALAPQLATGFRFDIIVSNPPYVPLTDASTMQAEVVDHEPHTALFAGDDGLDLYRRLIPAAHAALRPEGLLAMEFGFGQREALRELFASQPPNNDGSPAWLNLRFLDDYAGIPRIVLAQRA
ncbi:MAG: peptide chain release factor N(5)-glutamine methyltransferase [Acidobacteriota bacterium]